MKTNETSDITLQARLNQLAEAYLLESKNVCEIIKDTTYVNEESTTGVFKKLNDISSRSFALKNNW